MISQDKRVVAKLVAEHQLRCWRGRVATILRFCASLDASLGRGKARTAGEVRFIKDRAGDDNQWAWPNQNPSKREIASGYQFDAANLKPLIRCLRSTAMALGHALSAHNDFSKLKSRLISPDGNLGGRGYIQKIPDMRKLYMNCTEALSSIMDTLHDEIYAPHWQDGGISPRERRRVREIMQDVDHIREDPEGWAREEEDKSEGDIADDADGDQDTEGDIP